MIPSDMVSGSKILEDNYRAVYGVSSGLYSYEAVMGTNSYPSSDCCLRYR